MNQVFWFPLLIIFYALISAFGLYLLKAAQEIQSIGFIIGAFFYGSGFLIWMYILRLYPLSVAFPVAAGALIVGTQIAGILFLKEPFQIQTIAGITFIGIGILLICSTLAQTDG